MPVDRTNLGVTKIMAVNEILSLNVTEATREVFDILLPLGHSGMFLGRPGAGKSQQTADEARARIRTHGGFFLGWEAGDTLIVDNPPAGEGFKWAGDVRAPKIVGGLPHLVYRHCVMTGVTSLDLQGSSMPVDTSVTTEDYQRFGVQVEPISVFAKPFLFMGMPDKSEMCLLVLDEFAKTPENFPKYASLALGGRVGDHQLPGLKNSVLFIGNRPQDRAGSKDPTADINDRVRIFNVVPDEKGHAAWMRAHKYPSWAVAFCHRTIGADLVYDSPVPQDGSSYCSSRSFAMLVEELMRRQTVYGEINPGDRLVQNAILMKIGAAAGPRLLDLLKLGPQLPSMDEIIDTPETAKVPPTPTGVVFLMEVLARGANADNFKEVCTYVRRVGPAPRALFVNALVERHDWDTKRIEQGLPSNDPEASHLVVSPLPEWEMIYHGARSLREAHN